MVKWFTQFVLIYICVNTILWAGTSCTALGMNPTDCTKYNLTTLDSPTRTVFEIFMEENTDPANPSWGQSNATQLETLATLNPASDVFAQAAETLSSFLGGMTVMFKCSMIC